MQLHAPLKRPAWFGNLGGFAPQALIRKSNDTLVHDLNRARLAIDTQFRERFVRGSRQFDDEILHDVYT